MTKSAKISNRLLALLCTSALLAAMPLTFSMDAKTGVLALNAAVALADDNGGNDHGNRDGNGNDSGDDNGTGTGNGGTPGTCDAAGAISSTCGNGQPAPAPATL